MEKLTLSLATFLPRSRVNGPGVRSVLWVQGCPFRCTGCCNPEFQEFSDGTPHPPEEVAQWLVSLPDTEGVTFSGGEPFSQAAGLAVVAQRAQAVGKGVIVFTGYTWQELAGSNNPAWKELLASTDMLVAGPYRQEEASPHPLLASANQELIHLTGRYRDMVWDQPKRAEFRITSDGRVTMTGLLIPDSPAPRPPPARGGGENLALSAPRTLEPLNP